MGAGCDRERPRGLGVIDERDHREHPVLVAATQQARVRQLLRAAARRIELQHEAVGDAAEGPVVGVGGGREVGRAGLADDRRDALRVDGHRPGVVGAGAAPQIVDG